MLPKQIGMVPQKYVTNSRFFKPSVWSVESRWYSAIYPPPPLPPCEIWTKYLVGIRSNYFMSCENGGNSLQWRHTERDGVSNYLPHDCLLNRSFRSRSKTISKLHMTCLCAGNSPVTGEFPAQRPVTLKMFPFDDHIMLTNRRKWFSNSFHRSALVYRRQSHISIDSQ